MFTNHLVVYSPPKLSWFSVHTETGGYPTHDLGFFQVGPRINFTEAVPQLKKPLHHLFVTVLPRCCRDSSQQHLGRRSNKLG
jgi:hypothetical protein